MLALILAGLVYTILTDSIAVAILTASLILYRAQRPGQLRQRIQEWRYAQQAAQLGDQ